MGPEYWNDTEMDVCAIDITAEQRKTVLALLARHLPNTTAWVYGSRVKWTSSPKSDLDLVVFAKPEQERRVSDLREAFEESNLAFRVDLFVWDTVPEQFRKTIEAEHVVLVEREELRVGSEWVHCTLADACSAINYGLTASASNDAAGPKFLRITDIVSGQLDWNTVPHVVADKDSIAKYRLYDGDIVIARTGASTGTSLYIKTPPRAVFASYLVRLQAKPDFNARFLAYYLKSKEFGEFIRGVLGDKSAQPNASASTMTAVPLSAPRDRTEQRAIAHVLGTLDDKIELNRRMNQTLEEMARALFKSWFVDFDPVRAQATLKHHDTNHSPLEGESARQGRSPQSSRWGESRWREIKRSYTEQSVEGAKTLRQDHTDPEELLWHYLRNRQLDGYKFRRQQPIGPYVVDFACMSRKLVIELDGGQHAEQHNYDKKRDDYLRGKGYRILRFWNNEVFQNCMDVLETVWQALVGPPPHQPSPDGSASATPPQGGSDWSVERARAYLDRMDSNIAALFPDRFVDSELGPDPAGWGGGILDDLVELLSGGTPKTSVTQYWDGNIPWYTAKDAPSLSDVFVLETERSITQAGVENSSAKILPERTTIITARGTVGSLACLGRPMAMNQTCYGIRGARGYPDFFTYMNIRMTVDELQQRTHGTIFDTITRQTFKLVNSIMPPIELAGEFEKATRPMMSAILRNLHESRTLTALRDNLLLKLISGEIRLCDAERALEFEK